MILSFTLITFAMFAIWNESYRLRQAMRNLRHTISTTYGKADSVYQNPKQPQTWMRNNIIKSYK